MLHLHQYVKPTRLQNNYHVSHRCRKYSFIYNSNSYDMRMCDFSSVKVVFLIIFLESVRFEIFILTKPEAIATPEVYIGNRLKHQYAGVWSVSIGIHNGKWVFARASSNCTKTIRLELMWFSRLDKISRWFALLSRLGKNLWKARVHLLRQSIFLYILYMGILLRRNCLKTTKNNNLIISTKYLCSKSALFI